jgi:tRNA pseudouridine55 synthase
VATKPVPDELDIENLNQLLNSFRGAQKQIPSMYSALKHNGVPLYKLARQGLEVERKARDIFVHELEIISWKSPMLELKVSCSKGTYIRNLVEDIGFMIGCGAHVAALTRTRSGPYELQHTLSLQSIEEMPAESDLQQIMYPVDSAVSHYRKITLSDEQSRSLIKGQTVKIENLTTSGLLGAPLRLYIGQEDKFLGLGALSAQGVLRSIRLLNFNALDC